MSNTTPTLSFSGSLTGRFPAPDVARGFMLLLIAVANVPYWISESYFTDNTADNVWILIRGGLVDQRAYPLFALLFGFGLMTIINRQVTKQVNEGIPFPYAVESVRKLIRRRAWWMLLFGAVHSLIFAGDIIGAYGLAAAIFAGLLANKKYRTLFWVGSGIAIISILFALFSGFAQRWATAMGIDIFGADSAQDTLFQLGFFAPILSFSTWLFATPMTVCFSLVVPAMFIGARLADTSIISNPKAHKPLLWGLSIGGLAFAFLGSLPGTLPNLGLSNFYVWAEALTMLAGLCGAIGWLSLLTLWAGPAPTNGQLSGIKSFFANVGQRSMTAYLSQTLLFFPISIIVNAFGSTYAIGSLAAAGIAFVVWLIIAFWCQWMAKQGKRGPFEILLRRLTMRSAQTYYPQSFPPGSGTNPMMQ